MRTRRNRPKRGGENPNPNNTDDAETVPDLDPYDAETEIDERITERPLKQARTNDPSPTINIRNPTFAPGVPSKQARKTARSKPKPAKPAQTRGQPYTETEEFYDEKLEGAAEVVADSFSIKNAVRLVTLSDAYRVVKSHLRPSDQRRYDNDLIKYLQTPQGEKLVAGVSESVLLMPISEMFDRILGQDVADCLKRTHGTYRDFIEKSTAVTQCSQVIGPVSPNERTRCWICGGTIVLNNKNGLSPECEHVFPIAQAIAFTGLYETDLFNELKETNQASGYVQGLTLEYGWAHQICNQVKNDTHFIKIDKGVYMVDEARIVEFLDDIKNTTSWGGGANLIRHLNGQGITLKERVKPILQRCEKITNKITELKILNTKTSEQSRSLTPAEFAKCVAISIQQHVETDPTCSAPIPNITPRSRPNVTCSRPEQLTTSREDLIGITIQHWLPPFCTHIFGGSRGVTSQLIGTEQHVPINTKRLIQVYLTDLQVEFKKQLASELGSEIVDFQLRFYAFLADKYKNAPNKQGLIEQRYIALFSPAFQGRMLYYSSVQNAKVITDIVEKTLSTRPPEVQEYIKKIPGIVQNTEFQNYVKLKYATHAASFDSCFSEDVGTLDDILDAVSKTQPPPPPFPRYFMGGRRRKTKRRKTHRK
jgi:hypothetical protein